MNGPRRVYGLVGYVVLIAVLTVLMFLFLGCNLTKGRIKAPGITVQGQKDGNNASLASGKSGQVLPLPEGTKLVITKTEAVRAIPATDTTPAVAPKPATEVTEVIMSRDTEWRKEESNVVADTGTVDTSIAKHRIDVESAQPLLWASIGAAVLAAVFVYIKYPTPAMIFGGVSLIFFLSWKISNLPWWFWIIGVFGAGAGLFLWFGHRRGENDGVKAVLTGEVETKTQTVVKSP